MRRRTKAPQPLIDSLEQQPIIYEPARKRGIAVFSVIVAAAAVATAPTPDCPPAAPGQSPPATIDPEWAVKPRYEDIYWAFPRRAVAERVAGRATIRCEITEQGAADACAVVHEEPKGYGFGAAAVGLSSKMLFRPKVVCGVVTRGTVRVPISFNFPSRNPALSVEPLDLADKKQALAARLIAAMSLPEAIKSAVDMETLGVMDVVEESGHELSAEERMALNDAARETWVAAESKVLNGMARALAKRFDEQELAQAVAFYESPVGKKMHSVDQTMTGEMNAIFESVMPEMMMDFRRRFCERLPEVCARGAI